MPLPTPTVEQQWRIAHVLRHERLTEDETWVRDTADALIHGDLTYSNAGVNVVLPVDARYRPGGYQSLMHYDATRIQLGNFLQDNLDEARLICEMMLRIALANRREDERERQPEDGSDRRDQRVPDGLTRLREADRRIRMRDPWIAGARDAVPTDRYVSLEERDRDL